MSYQVLARKYRPQRFSDVIGQDHVTRTLKNAIEQQRIAHGYIFSGHRGIGKTTIARILAMALNCRAKDVPNIEPCGVCDSCTEIRAGNAVDVIEIDAATNRGIDEIRELREAARYRPARDRYKIYILDEAHQITDAAFNALLKTLEEPPAHIIFMMATTQPEDIPQTIRSRCQHFSFHAVRFDDIVGQLKSIAQQEGIQADTEALAVLAEAGDGSMRDALSIMDQAIACCGTTLTADLVRGLAGTVGSEIFETLMQAVADNSSRHALEIIDKLVIEGNSPMHFAKQWVRFLRNCTVAKIAGGGSSLLQISADERARVTRVAQSFSEEDLARFLQISLRTHDDLGYKQEQRFHLELGILKMVHAQRLLPLEELLSAQPLPQGSSGARTSASAPQRGAPAADSPATTSSFNRTAESSTARTPFDSDRARKSRTEMSSGVGTAQAAARAPETIATVVAATIAAANLTAHQEALPSSQGTTTAPQSADQLRAAVYAALEKAGHSSLVDILESGEWTLEGNELTVKVAKSAVMIEMSFGTEPQRVLKAALTQAVGRPLKVKIVPGASTDAATNHRGTSRPVSGGNARLRAADDPVVQHMQEKFGAEIRTVIDYREK